LFTQIVRRKVKVKFYLEQAMKAQRGSRGILSLTSALDQGWLVNDTPLLFYLQERDPVPIA
jgi:hypothetical protein